jgi:hypothetical protein
MLFWYPRPGIRGLNSIRWRGHIRHRGLGIGMFHLVSWGVACQ